MKEGLEEQLHKHFGYPSFRPGQLEVIQYVMRGESVLGMLATGGGKSITYQLPAMLLPGITVVISPLISLMMDQVQQLRAIRRIPATYLNSTLDQRDAREILREIERGTYKLLYISPEKLQQPYIQTVLRRVGVALIAVDEAHCISQWGHDFRTDYLRLPEVIEKLGKPPVLAVTATATSAVQKEICELLGIKPEHIVQQPLNRDNIAIERIAVPGESERRLQVLQLMDRLTGPGIVYCSTRQAVDVLVASYQLEGKRSVHGYHGGMNSMERMMIQAQFLAGELEIIVATNAFGMGIDKSDIRFVIHYQMPASLEAYAQEIGRVGRDGKPGYAALFYVWDDVQIHQHMMEREYPNRQQLQQFTELLLKGEPFTTEMLASIDMTQDMAELLLFYAERVGIPSRSEAVASMEPDALRDCGDAIMRELEVRKRLKQQKLAEMLDYVQEREVCLRKRINHYFGDSAAGFTLQCCSSCGLNRRVYEAEEVAWTKESQEKNWDLLQALSVLLPK
ncbi:RecQ family ATP-dependent DNA helicase [Brevibacillus invocatus]|uniref:ATP-dependent DNA helicase RecQ n=1 Tax=Brevibacillus invocatus TaxID=173959 RepID=A0A3M8CKJ5_9BACL|nr:ATP-dependent DNA helicase RecQ [Brevibacillus invocatus]RNB75385.1 RecQ family ATP-dependent DNA helicase [Brevibacillus invocatus]